MTAISLQPRARLETAPLIALGSVATAVAILCARPAIISVFGWSNGVVVTVFVLVLALGLTPHVNETRLRAHRFGVRPILTLGAGASVFIAGRVLQAGHSPAPPTVTLISLTTLAAIAEEALFRRVAFDLLLRWGPVAAVAGSALLFGVAHVTVYGWWAFPIDVAAGLVLGWQRWASGTWTVPAITHALADLLVVL